jgi:hypothetical protein
VAGCPIQPFYLRLFLLLKPFTAPGFRMLRMHLQERKAKDKEKIDESYNQ